MTPELRTACELVFQEHKLSHEIKWGKRAFRGQISIGLSELAKKTLVEKNIIVLPKKSKKTITQLNPDVASASSFEEAEQMIERKIPAPPVNAARSTPLVRALKEEPIYIAAKVPETKVPGKVRSRSITRIAVAAATPATQVSGIKWYLKPVFCYFVWPVCGLAVGALLSFLLDYAFSELFLHAK